MTEETAVIKNVIETATIIDEILAVDAQNNKPVKVKSHTNIAIKYSTRAKIEEYRKYERETYDEILGRWYAIAESRKSKKKGDE